MSSVNVNRKVTDSYYRYKMPKIVAKIEGRGNGIKTLIVNLAEISKALKRPVMYVLKYIGCEVGALSNADPKADRYVVNGVHDSEKLQAVMHTFIDRYVLCYGCRNPETQICVYPKREKIALNCTACGTKTDVPTSHKISAFMFKNPPPESKKTKVKVASRAKKMEEQTGDIDMPDQIKENEDDLELPDSYKNEVEDLSSRVSFFTATNTSEKKTKVRLEMLEKFIKDKLTKENDLNAHYDSIIAEAQRLALEEKYIFALCSCIFDENIVSQLRVHHSALSKFSYGNMQTQKYLLCWLECLLNSHESKLLPLVSTLFKMLYDAEIVTEEAFLHWKKKKKSRYVTLDFLNTIRSGAEKFMTWLENAEEESSEDDADSGSALDVEVTEPEKVELTTTQLPKIEEEDDFNIDEI